MGLAGAVSTAGAADSHRHAVVEKDVQIQTGDGTCDAAYLHPATGQHAGVIIWPDIFGLRPTFRAIGRRLAAAGYSVLVPNPFYRTAPGAPYTEEQIAQFNFGDANARAKMAKDSAPISMPGAIETDAKAHVGFLDSQPEVDTRRTDAPDSPHLLIPKFRAQMYIAIATSDDVRQPDAKDKLKAALAASSDPKVRASTVVVYQGMQHGWTVPDMPHQPNGKPTYNKPEAEIAWSHLLKLYSANLA
jgi:carboxymethylenebutenolidase